MRIYSNFTDKEVKENPFDSTSKQILLVEPPFYNLFGYERWHYPITLSLVGTYLEEKGHGVRIYDADKPNKDCRSLNRSQIQNNYRFYEKVIQDENHPAWRRIRQEIKNFNPDIVGITSITAKIDSANMIAKIAKDLYGEKVKIALGGAHAQGMRDMFPSYNFGPYYDYIITHIPNLINRKPNKNLLIQLKDYSTQNLSSILTSTGCPNSCTFCCNSGDRKMIYRNISSLEEELKELDSIIGQKSLYIVDDCFLSNSKRFREVGRLIKDSGFSFVSGSRIMALSKEKIEDFLDYNGKKIYLGVESGSQKILDKIQKRIKVGEIIERTKWVNEKGLPWSGFFIVGFPFETMDDLKMTEELIYKIEPTFVSLNRFTPYPGTKIWKDYYMDYEISFKDLFQLNPNNQIVRLDDKIKEYIEKMFRDFDDYNKNKNQQLNSEIKGGFI